MHHPFCPTTLQEWVSLVQSIVTTVAVGCTAWAGIRGLDTWRRQLHGTANLKMGRKLLLAMFQTREELLAMFVRVFPPSEVIEARQRIANGDANDLNMELYNFRWQAIVATLPAYETICVEAEALWGADIRTHVATFSGEINKFRRDLDLYLAVNTNNPGQEELRDKALGEGTQKALLAKSKIIEDYVRQKMAVGQR